MAPRIDVSRMLGSLDSDPFGRLVEAILLASTDPEASDPLNQSVRIVNDRLVRNANKPVLTIEQAKVFERITPPSFGLVPISQPAFIETLLVALYSRATELLRAVGNRAVLHNLNDLPARVEAGLNRMEPGVLGEFIIEAAIGAAKSPEVADRLKTSAEALRRRVPSLGGLKESAGVIFKPKDPGECECIVTGCNAYDNCQDFCIDSWVVCVLILIGIIIIIILS